MMCKIILFLILLYRINDLLFESIKCRLLTLPEKDNSKQESKQWFISQKWENSAENVFCYNFIILFYYFICYIYQLYGFLFEYLCVLLIAPIKEYCKYIIYTCFIFGYISVICHHFYYTCVYTYTRIHAHAPI